LGGHGGREVCGETDLQSCGLDAPQEYCPSHYENPFDLYVSVRSVHSHIRRWVTC
jgi:hypothetical protein